MAVKSLEDLFVHFLKDIYYAEKQVKKELPKMEKKATSKPLQGAFKSHLKDTEKQIDRLEKVFKTIGMKPAGVKCQAIDGILAEAKHIIKETSRYKEARDAALIACAQAAEHYELTRYGTLITYAELLGEPIVVKLLRDNMQEEANANRHLSELAVASISKNAA